MVERGAREIAATLFIVALTLAAYWTIRLALADQLFRSNSPEGAARAARLAPGNARYFELLAEYRQAEGKDPEPELAEASRLDPLNSAVWIRRGLEAEFDGDFARAEKFLLQAARVDKLFDPRATLANYYYRRNDAEQFWRWTRAALEIGYGDLRPLFRLCWRMSGDPEVIRSRALPPDRKVLRDYLSFLLEENRLDAAEPIARELAGAATSEDAGVLLDFIDRRPLVSAWNPLCVRGVIPFSPIAVDRPLTNGDFRFVPTSRGFDWRVPQSPDINAVRLDPHALRIDLSGRQPEHCELLSQFVPLPAARTCRLGFTYQTAGFPAESGLQWRILAAATPSLSSGDWKHVELTFATREGGLARLTLGYDRAAGTTRSEGSITLRDVELECAH